MHPRYLPHCVITRPCVPVLHKFKSHRKTAPPNVSQLLRSPSSYPPLLWKCQSTTTILMIISLLSATSCLPKTCCVITGAVFSLSSLPEYLPGFHLHLLSLHSFSPNTCRHVNVSIAPKPGVSSHFHLHLHAKNRSRHGITASCPHPLSLL